MKTIAKALMLASACLISSVAYADAERAAATTTTPTTTITPGTAVTLPMPFFAFNPETLINGASPVAAGASSQVRFLNLGKTAGTATVTLYEASSGQSLATWTSASVPALGYLQVDVPTIVAAATPKLTTSQAAAALQLGVRGTMMGTVQSVVVSNGIASDMTTCEPGGVFGGVAGAGHTTLMSGLEFSNHGNTAQTATVTLRSAAGTTLGTYTTASIPAHGVLTISGAAIAAAATPAVASSTVSYTAAAGGRGITVRHLSQPKAGGLVTNLTPACRIAMIFNPMARTTTPTTTAKSAASDGAEEAGAEGSDDSGQDN